ncbi:glycosyltransferase family 87 protein [Altererythrobacter ishigakiensis]|uniref:Uncharacterized protein DUF2029 n=1 Tax=Altererythrobacter ishigakiensis TaxID=476157 RepID=A0A562UW05_9SPHN|nr:glycosyltransferase family 87 protein [Altererythrobacter ishigakiensis]TWJ09812.1 uncharacterized protein DUF2029 [Altererythrobacter ishigakiensis]
MRWAWVILGAGGLAWLAHIFNMGSWPVLPLDASVYWAGGIQALSGEPSLIYRGETFDQYLAELHGLPNGSDLRFPYPPSLLLLLWPLGLLPFEFAWATFVVVGMAAFFLIARKFVDQITAVGMILAMGGPIHSIQLGQNGFYTAALLAGGLLALQRSKVLAGVLIGVLAFKPHLAIVGFFALLIWREWRALGWAIGTVLAMAVLSAVVFGPSIWLEFIAGNVSFADEVATSRRETLLKNFHQTTLSLTIPVLGMTGGLVAQALVALVALAVAAKVKERHLAIVGVLAATLLVAPYSFIYDSTMLVLACAILIHHDRQLSLGLALLIALTGLWFYTYVTIVPFVAATILVLAWMKDQNAGLPLTNSMSLGEPK